MSEKLIRFADLSKEEFRRLQLKMVEMLSVFDKFCEDNNLQYFLTNGTCLGAIRHKGFIPWDDDMDIALPRDDYERLFELWNNEGNRYQLLKPNKDTLTGVHIAQLRDSATTCIYEYAQNYDICHGIKIDVESIDGCPDGRAARFIQGFHCKVYGLMAAQRVPHHASYLMKIFARIVLAAVPSHKVRYFLFSNAEKQVKKYKIQDCKKLRFNYGLILDKDIYKEAIRVEFEGEPRPVTKEYDRYLTSVYGNYIQLPPQEKRIPETEVVCFDLDNSYIKYKGIKYCVKQ